MDQNPNVTSPINLDSKLSFEFLSYNHLAGKWEPLIEKFFVILNFSQIFKILNNENNVLYSLEVNAFDPDSTVININLSDINVKYFISNKTKKFFIFKKLK